MKRPLTKVNTLSTVSRLRSIFIPAYEEVQIVQLSVLLLFTPVNGFSISSGIILQLWYCVTGSQLYNGSVLYYAVSALVVLGGLLGPAIVSTFRNRPLNDGYKMIILLFTYMLLALIACFTRTSYSIDSIISFCNTLVTYLILLLAVIRLYSVIFIIPVAFVTHKPKRYAKFISSGFSNLQADATDFCVATLLAGLMLAVLYSAGYNPLQILGLGYAYSYICFRAVRTFRRTTRTQNALPKTPSK